MCPREEGKTALFFESFVLLLAVMQQLGTLVRTDAKTTLAGHPVLTQPGANEAKTTWAIAALAARQRWPRVPGLAC